MWHADQYDKLRHYGFGIHGCVDGFSRRVMWLRVYSTNRDPWIVAKYYYEVINTLKSECATHWLQIKRRQEKFVINKRHSIHSNIHNHV